MKRNLVSRRRFVHRVGLTLQVPLFPLPTLPLCPALRLSFECVSPSGGVAFIINLNDAHIYSVVHLQRVSEWNKTSAMASVRPVAPATTPSQPRPPMSAPLKQLDMNRN